MTDSENESDFESLNLSRKVLDAVTQAGYTQPTPIQKSAIPLVLERKDVIGIAQTGTGKTASFTLPMLTRLEKGRARARMPRTLILEPTRELAHQVEQSFNTYGVNHKLTVALLIGGVSFEEQNKKLDRGADILIATPGRLLDHFERGKLLLTGVEILVIDEADRMLDMGFIPPIKQICQLLPPHRQNLFFSATMPDEISQLVHQFMNAPERIEVAPPSSVASTLEQYVVASGIKDYEKRAVLRDLLRQSDDLQNAIIFCNRKRDVEQLYRSLEKHGFDVGALHGDLDQHQRLQMLDQFKSGEIKLLVASDVAARGLDISNVSHVFNFDIPSNAEDYVHRIGRAGRAGRKGVATSIVTRKDDKALKAIEALIKTTIAWQGEALDFNADGPATHKRTPKSRSQRKTSGSEDQQGTRRSKPEHTRNRKAGAKRKNNLNDTHDQKNSSESSNDNHVVGMGDHVPAFMMRQVK